MNDFVKVETCIICGSADKRLARHLDSVRVGYMVECMDCDNDIMSLYHCAGANTPQGAFIMWNVYNTVCIARKMIPRNGGFIPDPNWPPPRLPQPKQEER